VSDPNQSYDAGRLGRQMPTGGDANAWQAGWVAGQQLRDQNARQGELPGWGAPVSQPGSFLPKPYDPGIWNPIGSLAEVLRANPKVVVLALVVAAIPLYRYTIPLWAAMYPGAAVVAAAATWVAYHAVGTGAAMAPSDRLLLGGGVLLVTVWLTTVVDVRVARQSRTYRTRRHLVRLGLIFLWGLFALTVYEHIRPMPGVALQIPPRLDWSIQNIALALAAAGMMHLWLSGKFPWEKLVGK
jgi:hypothetical protein